MQTRNAVVASTLFLLAACGTGFEDKPKAEVKDAPAAAETDKPAAPAAGETTLDVLADSSAIGFVGAKLTGTHEGSFKKFTGSATLKDGKATSVNFEVDTTSVVTDAEKLTGHLKSADFFDVEKFPKASFASTKITEKAEGDYTHEIEGTLDLHGKKKVVKFPAKVTVADGKASGVTEFTINRKDFGIVYAGMPDDLIKDEVLMKLNLNFTASEQ